MESTHSDKSSDSKDIQIYARMLLGFKRRNEMKKAIKCLRLMESLVVNATKRLKANDGVDYFNDQF